MPEIDYDLFEHKLNEKEQKAYVVFGKEHKASCYPDYTLSAIEVTKERTDKGIKITVKCPECKAEEDITDYEGWKK
ncbi:Uncharacterised protein [uncultured archaeon]|nr:Uncharacterised protein [uncultured archaeon]